MSQDRVHQLLQRSVAGLLRACTGIIAPSDWKWGTSGGGSAGIGLGKLTVGGTGGEVFLYRGKDWEGASDRVRLEYGGFGVSVGVGIPIPFMPSATYAADSWNNVGRLFLIDGNKDFASPEDFNATGVGVGPCVIIVIDAALVPLRWLMYANAGTMGLAQELGKSEVLDRQIAGSAGMMLLGVNEHLFALLRDFMAHVNKLAAIVGAPPRGGVLAQVVDAYKRPFLEAGELLQMELDMFSLLARIQSIVGLGRAVLFSAGVEASLPGISISVYYGLAKGARKLDAQTSSPAVGFLRPAGG